jgi:adenylate cyclase
LGDTAVRQRLAAILAADAAGYSRLMSGDERGTVATLDAARGIFKTRIESQQGRVIDMAGDSVLAAFETATGAVLAAVEIQKDLDALALGTAEERRMRFRIGVHLGDVFEKADGSIYGDGVNMAARLQTLAEPGAIAVSGMVQEAVRDRLPVLFEDGGEHAVKNIRRPLRVFHVRISSGKPSPLSIPAMPQRPSIAVLPFDNMSGDPEQGFFADGMAEDIITLLSRVPDLFVIARNSTFVYKGRSSDVRKVAGELGVRYVLEGSVRKSANRIRITAQFIDAETGGHIWAERYDRELQDIFAVQDEVTQGIVGVLQSRLLHAEVRLARRKAPEAVDAWGNLVQAKVKLFAHRRRDIDEAEPFARKAIEIAPDYAEAHAVLGHVLAWRSYNGWTEDWYQTAKEAVLHCERAVALAPNDPNVLTHAGAGQWTMGRFVKALPILERAISLNANAAYTCAIYGLAVACAGRSKEGVGTIQQAFRLSPKDPIEYLFHSYLAHAEYFAGGYEAAMASATRALQIIPDLIHPMMIRAACCVRLGQEEEAQALALGSGQYFPSANRRYRLARIHGCHPAGDGQGAEGLAS